MRFDLLVLCCILADATIADRLDVDFNRLRLVPAENTPQKQNQEATNHYRRSISNFHRNTDDYDDHSSGLHSRASSQIRAGSLHTALPPKSEKGRKVYQPKQDPGSFYQSESYAQQIMGKNKSMNALGGIFPGYMSLPDGKSHSEDPRFTGALKKFVKTHGVRKVEKSERYQELNSVMDYDENICIKCPAERTLVAKPGVDKVLLQHPRLKTCSGMKPPRGVHFVRLYGPTFGSLIAEGSHMIVGKIVNKGQELQYCRYQVGVVMQLCPVPSHLRAECERSKCNLTCTEPALELVGPRVLHCGTSREWSGDLPVCRARTWCHPPQLPDHGQLSCQTTPAGWNGLAEGSRCRARCAAGYRAATRRAAVCRRGAWTHTLLCMPRHKTSNYTSR